MNLLKNIKLTDILIVIFAAAIAFAIGKTCNHIQDIDDNEKIENIKEKRVTHYEDKNGIDHAEKPVAEAGVDAINIHYDHIIDSLTKVINTKAKNIAAVTAIGAATKGTITPSITYKKADTCITQYADSVKYDDKWLTLAGDINTKKFDYTVRDSIILTTYYKRAGFLKKELYVNAYSNNPHTTISGITSLHLSQAKPLKFGIGLQVGYSWNGSDFKPAIGIGVSYNLVRF